MEPTNCNDIKVRRACRYWILTSDDVLCYGDEYYDGLADRWLPITSFCVNQKREGAYGSTAIRRKNPEFDSRQNERIVYLSDEEYAECRELLESKGIKAH